MRRFITILILFFLTNNLQAQEKMEFEPKNYISFGANYYKNFNKNLSERYGWMMGGTISFSADVSLRFRMELGISFYGDRKSSVEIDGFNVEPSMRIVNFNLLGYLVNRSEDSNGYLGGGLTFMNASESFKSIHTSTYGEELGEVSGKGVGMKLVAGFDAKDKTYFQFNIIPFVSNLDLGNISFEIGYRFGGR